MSIEIKDGLPIQYFQNQEVWREWLLANKANTLGVWVKISKKASGIPSVTYAEALEEALCFGWIDGQKQTYDDKFFLQRFTPRRPRSIWSKVNVAKVAALIEAGRMQPGGFAAIEAAKQNGEWEKAYDAPSASVISEDFQTALDQKPKAKAFYETLNKANKYAINWRIQSAKRPETRAAHIEKFVAMLERGEKLH